MTLTELLLLAIGLSMDAFAAAVCKGLSIGRPSWPAAAAVGLFFGGFQALMPLAGYLLGIRFSHVIAAYDHWFAFLLLSAIGLSMLRDSLRGEENHCSASLRLGNLLLLSLAVSIDALTAGLALSFLQARILPAAALIGVTAFFLSAIGAKAGSYLGERWKSRAEQAGAVLLLLMGASLLANHLLG